VGKIAMLTKRIDLNNTELSLTELFDQLTPDTEILVFKGEEQIARIAQHKKHVFGLHQGQSWMSDDFCDDLPDSFSFGEGE
jgi:hypothetical protein